MNKSDAALDIERIAMNIQEAAIALGIDHERMGGLVRIGRVPHLRLGERVLIGKRALDEWLNQECWANVRPAEQYQPPVLVQTRNNRAGAARQ